MKKRFVIFILVASFINVKASDTLNISKDKRFIVGGSVAILSTNLWTKTDTFQLVIQGHEPDVKPYIRVGAFNQYGLTFAYKIYKFIYFETGGTFIDNKLFELADNVPDTKYGAGQNYSFTYQIKYFQIPVSITYLSNKSSSLYINLGVKSNFIYKERLYGNAFTYEFLAPPTYVGGRANIKTVFHPVDKSDNNFKFYSIVPTINIGGVFWLLKRRLGIMVYGYADLKPIMKNDNTIFNFSFYPVSLLNLKVLYRF